MSLGSVPSSILNGASTSAKIATSTSSRMTNAPTAAEGFERQKSPILRTVPASLYSSVIRGSNFLYSTSTMTFITITMNENTSTQPCTSG